MLQELSLGLIGIFIVALLISMAVHEATHAFVAHKLGDTTAAEEGRLTLNPFRHIDLYTTILLPVVLVLLGLPPILAAKPVPFDPSQVRYGEYGAALMAVAGPFSNLALATAAAIAWNAGLFSEGLTADFMSIFIPLNVALFVFNMLPIPPLDGSRLLYAFAPEPLQRIMAQIEAMGFMLVLLILLLLLPVLAPVLINVNEAILSFLL